MSDLPGICCGLCRIGCFQAYQVCCCVKEAPPTPTYNIICLGISNAGKTTLLTILKFENPDAIVPTIGKVIGMLIEFVKSNAFHLCMAGFSVKDILLPNATLKVKELGGAAPVRQYWNRYYSDVHGVIFVVDCSCTEEEMTDARQEMHKALQNPQISSVPWLILCNKQDVDGAMTEDRAFEELNLADVTREQRDICIRSSSKADRDRLHAAMEEFASKLNKIYRPHAPDEASEPMTSI